MMKYLRDDARFKLEEILYAFGYIVVRDLHNISYTSLMSLKFLPRRLLLAVELTDYRRIALLRVAVDAELHRRRKLPHVNTIDDVVNLIKTSEKIIVLAGAGNLSLYLFDVKASAPVAVFQIFGPILESTPCSQTTALTILTYHTRLQL
jgi:hypothetical protein